MNRRRVLVVIAGAGIVLVTTVAAALARPGSDPPRDEPVAVDGYRLVGGDRLLLGYSPVTVHCGGGPLHIPEVTETSSSVEVRLAQTVTNPDGPCIAVAEIGRVEIALDAPLERRSVIDASTGRGVPAGLDWTPFD